MDQNRNLRASVPAGFMFNSPVESPVASPFVRIENDLEELVNALDEESNAKLTTKHSTPPSSLPMRRPSQNFRISKDDLPPFRRPLNSLEPTTMTQEPLQGSAANISKSLWIGNLDPSIVEADLRRIFEPFGTIDSMRLLPAKECAFVNYAALQDAVRAKDALQGAALGSMIIRIGYGKTDAAICDTAKHPVSIFSQGPGGLSSGTPIFSNGNTTSGNFDNNTSRSVWVGHVGPDVDVEALQEAFAPFGQIESIRILDIKNCAFVNYSLAEDAARARHEMNGARIGNSFIKTGLAKSNASSRNDLEVMVPSRKTVHESIFGNNMTVGDTLSEASNNIVISTHDVAPNEFVQPVLSFPDSLSLPEEMNANVIRECRRRVEHPSVTPEEIDEFSLQIMEHILPASIDPMGNILVQKLIEKGSDKTRDQIIERLGKHLATVGIHKNGTWVVQRLLNHCGTTVQMKAVSNWLRPHLVPLLQDPFGNYVVQGSLIFGSALNQFIFDALYHRCVEIATSRFGSRALRSCLESPHASDRQKKFVAMAIISHALKLVYDVNGVIVLQWFLDSDLPGRHAFIASVLKDHFAQICLSKHASSIVAKLVHPSADSAARNMVIAEIFNSKLLPNLLREPISAAILLRCLTTVRPEQKIHLSHLLYPHLSKGSASEEPVHLKKVFEEVEAAVAMVTLEPDAQKGGKLEFESVFRAKSGLLNHAVGGPVSNAPGATTATKVVLSQNGLDKDRATQVTIPLINRSMSFGTVTTLVPQVEVENSISKLTTRSDKLFFGPSLVDRTDAKLNRPPTPS